jgi:peptidoglycan-N-acetylglucosamine deacetylase
LRNDHACRSIGYDEIHFVKHLTLRERKNTVNASFIKYLKVLLFIGSIYFFEIPSAFSMDMVITVDDIPANGDKPLGTTRLEVAQKMLLVFKKHHIGGVYGLINGDKIEDSTEGLAVAEEWLKSGQLLGNHTFSHLDLAKTNSNDYIANIKKNDALLKKLMGNKDYRYFRYPYLSEGNTAQKRDAVRRYLDENHYKIAPVTVDFFDYEWNDAYIRCLKKSDLTAISWLKRSYVEQALNALTISHSLSMMLFKRDIKNVLLIHINPFSAEMLDELLNAYEKHNVQFISLSEALQDDVYKINPNIIRDRAYTFLNQVRLARGLENPPFVSRLYTSLPEDKLSKLCL